MAKHANSTRTPAIRRALPPELSAVPAAAAVPSDGLRALTMYDVVPPGHIGVLVENRAFEPHLHAGEFAIVDTADKERQVGELYVLMIGVANPQLKIVELLRDWGGKTCSVGVWYAFSLVRDVPLGDGSCGRMVDGPLGFEYWPDKCRGRVVGVMPGIGGRHV